MSTSVFQCHWSRLEFFDVANLGNMRPACEYKKNTKEGEEEKLNCYLK